jgi:hypothetical protein
MALMSAGAMPVANLVNPTIDVAAQFQQGRQDAAVNQSNDITNEAAQLEVLATGAAYAMPQGPNGPVDPAKWNEVLDTYEASGMPPEKVKAFRDNPNMAAVLLKGSTRALAASNDAALFDLEKQKLEAEIAQAANGGGANAETWGLTPQAYEIIGPDGTKSVKIGVLSNRGNFKEVPLPDGANPAFPTQQLNTGTGFTEVGKYGGTTGNTVPIDNIGKSRDEEIGKIAGQNVGNAPKAVETANRTLATIDNILNDPALPQAVGLGGMLPAIPGTDQAGVIAKIDQLKGQAFLEAFNSLKGGGQITEVEGKKATDAIARLDRAQNLEDFTSALNELRAIVDGAKTRALQQTAGGAGAVNAVSEEAPTPDTEPAPPAVGEVVDGYEYVGGDPANEKSWKPVN